MAGSSQVPTNEDVVERQLPLTAQHGVVSHDLALVDASRGNGARQDMLGPDPLVQPTLQLAHAPGSSPDQLSECEPANLTQDYKHQVVQIQGAALTRATGSSLTLLPLGLQIGSNSPAAAKQPQQAAPQDCSEGIPFIADCCVTAVLVPVLMAHCAYGIYKQGPSFLKQVWYGTR